MKVLVIDNYDSFTYNLVYFLRQEKADVNVYRNDKITAEECSSYDRILLSPGPGIPRDAGNLAEIINQNAGKVPILGICLGHQAIGEFLGCSLNNMEKVYHGVQTDISKTGSKSPLFDGMPDVFKGGRYHSWEVDKQTVNGSVEIIAEDEQGAIMGIQNSSKRLYGIQFHPESVLTPEGPQIIKNFLKIESA
jgi:anthranilate synthase component 2